MILGSSNEVIPDVDQLAVVMLQAQHINHILLILFKIYLTLYFYEKYQKNLNRCNQKSQSFDTNIWTTFSCRLLIV
jgi:hypothetical protein